MLDWIVEGLRWIIWGIISAGLILMDVCYDLVEKIASVDFFQEQQVWQWYYVFISFLGILVIFRAISVYIKFSFDEEFRDRVSASHFIHKLSAIALTVALLPFILGFVSQISVWSINNMHYVLGNNATTKPSTFIITSFMNTDNGEFDKNGNWVSGAKITYTLEDIDINAEGEGDKDYKYFNDVSDLFILTFIGIAASIILILNGVLIAKRSISVVVKTIIAPIPISSLIVPGDETFAMWRKMIISDYVLNFFQTLMIMIVMILSGSKIVQNMGVWVQILIFIGGLLLLLSGIPELSKILGGDTSQASVLQQIASFRMATRGAGASVSRGMSKIGQSLSKNAGMASYGFGRLAGGKSISELQKNAASKTANGFMGGSGVSEDNRNNYTTNYSDANFQNKNDVGGSSVLNHNGEKMDSRKSDSSNGFISGERTHNRTEQLNGGDRLSREGSIARSFADRAETMNGITGFSARFAANSSKHLYQKSMRDMQSSKIYRASCMTKSLGSRKKIGGDESA